ncbi:MAG: helix-turn-helix transcriptional regulator [Hyphomicrobiales bacterium]|nr:helix-turn-helix transcriptional regulator [Hyphomicrobiales bacterium]
MAENNSEDFGLAPAATETQTSLGRRVREMRKARGWTLADLSERTGLALSTISKMERGEISLTYDRFMRLAQGLGLDVGELFDPKSKGFKGGSLSISRAGEAPVHETPTYVYKMPASDLAGKHMVPMEGRIKAHDRAEFSALVSHPGEEFMYVLTGELEVHVARRAPVRLTAGDSIYFDSSMEHIYVSAGDEDAHILVVCWKPG